MSRKYCRRLVVGPAVAVLIFSVANTFAANAVPNAPSVPPAPVIEKPLTPVANDAPGEQPSSQHVWVPGHWRWHEGAYVWEAGRWEVPPAPNVTWHPPEWQQQANGYVLREGYWAEPTPQSAHVVSASAQSQAAQTLSVTEPPPPPQREVIHERPSGAHVWVPGYWMWRDGRHVWVAGRWEVPPRANVTWVPPRWEMRDGRYVFVDGFWRDTGVLVTTPPPAPPQQAVAAPPPQQQIIVVTPPPPVRQEVVYARPSRNHVWVPGYWSWQGGRYVWIAGHYSLPPRGRDRWVPPRWERRGTNYVFIEGHWR